MSRYERMVLGYTRMVLLGLVFGAAVLIAIVLLLLKALL